tara:strand:+ start:53 stop:325 length:273 start_codon:yes stop_codon:yes gene_type:complete
MKRKYPKTFPILKGWGLNPFEMDDAREVRHLIFHLNNKKSFQYAHIQSLYPVLTHYQVAQDCFARLRELGEMPSYFVEVPTVETNSKEAN